MSNTIHTGDLIAAITGGAFETSDISSSEYTGVSPASLIAQLVVESGAMTAPESHRDWPLFVSHMPNDVVNCGCIYDTSGVQDGRISKSGEVIEHYGIQLTIRSNSYEIGRAKAEQVALILDSIFKSIVVVNSVSYEIQNIKRMSSVISLGTEPGSQRNQIFTVNFLVTINS